MTTSSGAARARRRLLARLAVVGGSALALAASWVGVVRADRSAAVHATPVGAPIAIEHGVVPSLSGESGLVPVQPATRRVVVRTSRAS